MKHQKWLTFCQIILVSKLIPPPFSFYIFILWIMIVNKPFKFPMTSIVFFFYTYNLKKKKKKKKRQWELKWFVINNNNKTSSISFAQRTLIQVWNNKGE